VVVKTTVDGEEVFTLRYSKAAEPYNRPGPDGNGYGSSYINQYNSKSEYIRTFGGLGMEAGQVNCPHGLMVDMRGPEPILNVADRSNRRLQRFTLDGKHVNFGSGVNLPCHFNTFRNGDMVVPDLAARVSLAAGSQQ
jgi:hypothetical protein